MSRITYIALNLSTSSIGVGAVGFLGPGEQKSFTVEEDSPDDTALNNLASTGRVSILSATPLKTGGGTGADLNFSQLSSLQQVAAAAAVSGASLTVALNGSNKLSTVSRAGDRTYVFTDPDSTHEVCTASDGAILTVTKDSGGRVVSVATNY